MRGIIPAVLILIVTLTILMTLPAVAAEKRVIIGFHKQPGPAEISLLRELGGKVRHRLPTIRATAAIMTESAIGRLKADHKVAYVEEDAPTALVETLKGVAVFTAKQEVEIGQRPDELFEGRSYHELMFFGMHLRWPGPEELEDFRRKFPMPKGITLLKQ